MLVLILFKDGITLHDNIMDDLHPYLSSWRRWCPLLSRRWYLAAWKWAHRRRWKCPKRENRDIRHRIHKKHRPRQVSTQQNPCTSRDRVTCPPHLTSGSQCQVGVPGVVARSPQSVSLVQFSRPAELRAAITGDYVTWKVGSAHESLSMQTNCRAIEKRSTVVQEGTGHPSKVNFRSLPRRHSHDS